MNTKQTYDPQVRFRVRQAQDQALREAESELRALASEGKKEEFLERLAPLLQPVKSYIKRRLRLAYANSEIRSNLYSSDDILDEVILRAYERYGEKPQDLTLQQWLYQLTNRVLEDYLRETKFEERHRVSLEGLRARELRGLEERMTADAEGEPWLVEDLGYPEYEPRDFIPPHYEFDPLERLDKQEQTPRIIRALSSLPIKDRIVFELLVMEGLSPDAVAKILDMPPDEVLRTAERVKKEVFQEINVAEPGHKKAS
jgi:RNA polymerase sigma factor (sigma-70 family)